MGPKRSQIARCVGFLVACVALLWSSTASAQDWDPFPSINGAQHAGIIKRYDSRRYDDLRRCLRRFDSKVGATYYGAMVDVTDEGGSRSRKSNDATKYADALAREWASEPGIDLDKHVLIVLGVQNRSLGIDVGSEWEKIGFSGPAVEDTVEASEYDRLMRRRDYGGAICSLTTAIDFKLAQLQQAMARRVEEVGATFPEVEKELTDLTGRVDATFTEERPFAEGIRADLATASKHLDEAKTKLEDDPASSVGLVDKARNSMRSAEEALERYNSEIERLETVEADLKKAQAEITDRDDFEWAGPQAANARLAECKEMVSGVRDRLEGDPADIRTCIAEVRGMLAAADVRHEYLAGIIPTIFAAFFLLLIIAIVSALVLRRRRRIRLIDQDLGEWDKRLKSASLRANALMERFPDYFALGDVAWTGESAELDARTADSINRAFFLLERGQGVLNQAKSARGAGHPLSVIPLEKAARALREAPTDVPAGTVVEASPLTVTTSNGYSATSASLLGDLHDALRESEALLVESASVLQRLATATDAGDEAERDAVSAVDQRQNLGLTADHLLAPLEEAREQWAQAREFTARDPLRSDREGVLEQAREKMLAIRKRAVGGNEVVEAVRGDLAGDLNAMRHALSQLAADGFELSEPNFDAREQLEALRQQSKALIGRVESGDERRAIPEFEELRESVDELATRIQVTREARQVIPGVASFLDGLREAVRGDILKLRIGIGKLEDGSIPKAELDELNAFQTTLGRVNGELSRLQKAHGNQAYLAATAQAHRIMELMRRGVALVNDLANRSNVGLQNTPAQVTPPAQWSDSALATWKSEQFGATASARKLF